MDRGAQCVQHKAASFAFPDSLRRSSSDTLCCRLKRGGVAAQVIRNLQLFIHHFPCPPLPSCPALFLHTAVIAEAFRRLPSPLQ